MGRGEVVLLDFGVQLGWQNKNYYSEKCHGEVCFVGFADLDRVINDIRDEKTIGDSPSIAWLNPSGGVFLCL